MPAEVKVEVSAEAQEYMRRLSVVHAYDLRLTIVTELFLREMSPTQFHLEFGGGSVARVERHFEKLVKSNWLRLVREESGGRRRGGREHFYRATELAIFDLETWSLLPYSVRAAYGWTTFRQLAARVREALEAGTFDTRPDRRLGSTLLLLDELGRERILRVAEKVFKEQVKEQGEAKLRVFESGEKPFMATVAIAGFESPGGHASLGSSTLPEGTHCLTSAYHRLSKVIGDELCLSIVEALNLREMSATQYYHEIGGASKSAIRYRFEMLERIGCLARLGKMPRNGRRGPREHAYRAAGPVFAEDGIWSGLPGAIEASDDWRTFMEVSGQVKGAIKAGTFDARPDRHLTWMLLSLDAQGWKNVIAGIDALLAFVTEERDEAALRLAESGETPTELTVATMAFESPRGSEKKL